MNIESLRKAKEVIKTHASTIGYPKSVGINKSLQVGLTNNSVRVYVVNLKEASLFPSEVEVDGVKVPVDFVESSYHIVAE